MAVDYKPKGAKTVTPYLAVPRVPALIEFLKATFDATEIDRAVRPDGGIMNATIEIEDSRLMMGDPGDRPPETAMLYVYVQDCDAVYEKALTAGATSLMAPTDQFYGDRCAAVQDGSGNKWWLATHKEDLTAEEGEKRVAARFGRYATKEGHR